MKLFLIIAAFILTSSCADPGQLRTKDGKLARLDIRKTMTRNVDLATMPIYIRVGAIIPFDPVKQYTAEITDQPVTIKVFTGKDGQFVWYEDDGISLNYLKEGYRLTQLSWNDAKRNLSIRSKGNFKSAPRTLVIHLVNENVMKSIKYNNESISVLF